LQLRSDNEPDALLGTKAQGSKAHWLLRWEPRRLADGSSEAMQYTKSRFPKDALIRRDDVAQFLVNVIEVDPNFKNHLASNKLKQKYWANHFADLIIDRTWAEITNAGGAA
jgi:hypothetical protein